MLCAKHSSFGARRGGGGDVLRPGHARTTRCHAGDRLHAGFRSRVAEPKACRSFSASRVLASSSHGSAIFWNRPDRTWWMSMFDRSMITMVLLLTLALAWNRQPLIASLAERTEALEHAKDTIQSANQELVVVNQELQRRNVDLSQLNDDLSNLLTGVGLPIVMLCKDLQIRRFTPAAADALHLVPEDVGRPIGKINCTCGMRDLETMVLDAVASNTPDRARGKGRCRTLAVAADSPVPNR